MAARFVRRSFAAPFVVTLATLPACIVQSSGSTSTGPSRQPHAHDHRTSTDTPPPATHTPPPATHTPPPATNTPPPSDQVVVANPPRPTTQPAQPTQPTRPPVVAPPATTADPKQPPVVVANPPRPTGAGTNPPPANTKPGTVVSDTKPTPTADRRWTVSRANGTCKAYIQTTCPTAPKGQPQPTCNPPPPAAYTCPDNLADGESMKVVQRAGESECWIDWGNITCPKNAKCNPPPPRKVACPK